MISDCKSRDKRLLPDALSVSYDLQGENWHQEHCLNSLSKELLEGVARVAEDIQRNTSLFVQDGGCQF